MSSVVADRVAPVSDLEHPPQPAQRAQGAAVRLRLRSFSENEFEWRHSVSQCPGFDLQEPDAAAAEPRMPLMSARVRVLRRHAALGGPSALAPAGCSSDSNDNKDSAHAAATAAWPRVWVQFTAAASGPVQMAPHPQWEELGEPAMSSLAPQLQQAITAHVTSGMRHCLARCLQRLGCPGNEATLPLAAPPTHADSGRHEHDVLEIQLSGARLQNGWTLQLPVAALPSPSQARVRLAPGALDGPNPRSVDRFDPWVDVRAVVGLQRLTTGAIGALKVSDFVVLAHPPGAERPSASSPVQAPGRVARAAWLCLGDHLLGTWQAAGAHHGADSGAGGHLQRCLITPLNRLIGDSDMTSDSTPPAAAAPATFDGTGPPDTGEPTSQRVREVTLLAEAVIDAPAQRISDIQRWQPGMLIRLASSVDGDRIHLRVNGRTLARGRLASVGETLAFEVLELFD